MKKLMIAALAAIVGIAANAAAVTWTLNSGAFYGAASADGGWGSTKLTTAGAVAGYLFIVDSSAYDTFGGLSKSDIYAGFTANGESSTLKLGESTFTVDKTGANLATGTMALKGTKSDYAAGDTAYGVVLYTYHDNAYDKDYFIANASTVTFGSASSKSTSNMATIVGGGTSGTSVGGWQAVPEPTSGLMMLIGMGVLALRRRRA